MTNTDLNSFDNCLAPFDCTNSNTVYQGLLANKRLIDAAHHCEAIKHSPQGASQVNGLTGAAKVVHAELDNKIKMPDGVAAEIRARLDDRHTASPPSHYGPRAGLPLEGYIRLPQVLAVIPVSKSSWWAGVKTGRYPPSTKIGPRTTVWRVDDIRRLIEKSGRPA